VLAPTLPTTSRQSTVWPLAGVAVGGDVGRGVGVLLAVGTGVARALVGVALGAPPCVGVAVGAFAVEGSGVSTLVAVASAADVAVTTAAIGPLVVLPDDSVTSTTVMMLMMKTPLVAMKTLDRKNDTEVSPSLHEHIYHRRSAVSVQRLCLLIAYSSHGYSGASHIQTQKHYTVGQQVMAHSSL
jgi:hypothetical protein